MSPDELIRAELDALAGLQASGLSRYQAICSYEGDGRG